VCIECYKWKTILVDKCALNVYKCTIEPDFYVWIFFSSIHVCVARFIFSCYTFSCLCYMVLIFMFVLHVSCLCYMCSYMVHVCVTYVLHMCSHMVHVCVTCSCRYVFYVFYVAYFMCYVFFSLCVTVYLSYCYYYFIFQYKSSSGSSSSSSNSLIFVLGRFKCSMYVFTFLCVRSATYMRLKAA
jgi:hypothetical protein